MVNINIIDASAPPLSVDFELIRAIINRVIGDCLSKTLGIVNVNVAKLEWYPAWRLDKLSKQKKLNVIYVRSGTYGSYKKINERMLLPLGLLLPEFFEFLKKSSAKRVKCTGGI